ncbi:unnamed protein product [Auanema sp. JU1783]|nr:unnamed protein product [Auanema sp. JU1783]
MIMSNLPLVHYYEEYIAESLDHHNSSSEVNKMIAQRGQSPQSPSKHITVVDVYDLAASIGKDFERLIELHGNECVRGIMPKVISALETLESLANNNDKENEEIISLQKTIDRLEQEKHTKQLQSSKFEDELEQIEETYKKDITELRDMVKSLLCENRTLSSTVSSLPPIIESSGIPFKEEDVRLMLELKDCSVKQKEEIKNLQKDNEHYATEIEQLQNAVEKLIRQNEELLRKNSSLQKQGRVIVEEKTAVMKRLEKSEEAYIQIEKLLKETNRTCRDLQQANMLDDEPRFTLAELREVLQEKNVLKGRVMELEEELEVFKPGSARKEFEKLDDTPEPEEEKSLKKDEEDLPVYGPLPREPDEKLHPWKYERKDSGVRKFFRFFKDWGQPASPRQPSSAQNSPRPVRSSTSSTLAAVANS